jgi:hypothetical protein
VTEVENPEAFRIAEALRGAMAAQDLNGAELADRVEKVTGERPNAMRVSRWLNPEPSRVLIRIHDDLAIVAQALGLDRDDLICDAVRGASVTVERLGVTPNLYQSNRCEHPNLAGEGCQACCDDCNSDRHGCQGCGTPVGHRDRLCDDCPDPDEE